MSNIPNQPEFLIFDTETVDLSTEINQIIQFAAIVLTHDLQEKERMNIRVRLKEGVPVGIGACMVTGNTLSVLNDPAHMSEYEFSKILNSVIKDRIIAGYNSHGYDDKMVAQCLYQNLFNPYQFKMGTGGTLDVLTLVAAATHMTNLYSTEINEKGNKVLKLGSWCQSNGITVDHTRTHDALYDVELTVSAMKLIRQKSPEIYNDWIQSRNARLVGQRVMKELYFRNINVYFGKAYEQVCTYINSDDKSMFLFDMSYDVDEISMMDEDELLETIGSKKKWKPIRHIKINKNPIICGINYTNLTDEEKAKHETTLLKLVNNPQLMTRLKNVCVRYLKEKMDGYSKTTSADHVVQRINESFTSFGSEEEQLMLDFHSANTMIDKLNIARKFTDDRHRIAGFSIVYHHDKNLLKKAELKLAEDNLIVNIGGANTNIERMTKELKKAVTAENLNDAFKSRLVLEYISYLATFAIKFGDKK